MKALKFKFVIKILEESGFYLDRQKGSHLIYKNDKGKTTLVASHGKNNEIPTGVMLAIIKQSGLDKNLFQK